MIPFHPTLLWIDMEMSGLDPKKNRILEFACILSDTKATKTHQGPHIIVKCDEEHLKSMDEWNTVHHTASGLYQNCLKSTITNEQAQQQIIEYLKGLGVSKGQLIVAGNSVHQDKRFLYEYMPNLCDFLHYRILDVTSLKIVVDATKSGLFYHKKNLHRAIDDILESIEEYKFYLKNAFK